MKAANDLVLGYHGCDRHVGEAAIAGTHLNASANSYDWLGHGIYFWQGDAERAAEWASKQDGIRDPFVLGAAIRLGRCLDLVEVEYLELVREAYQSLHAAFEVRGVLPHFPRNEVGFSGDDDLVRRHLDCAVINHVHELREDHGADSCASLRSRHDRHRGILSPREVERRARFRANLPESFPVTHIWGQRPTRPTANRSTPAGTYLVDMRHK